VSYLVTIRAFVSQLPAWFSILAVGICILALDSSPRLCCSETMAVQEAAGSRIGRPVGHRADKIGRYGPETRRSRSVPLANGQHMSAPKKRSQRISESLSPNGGPA
jgi:hypothetical protein